MSTSGYRDDIVAMRERLAQIEAEQVQLNANYAMQTRRREEAAMYWAARPDEWKGPTFPVGVAVLSTMLGFFVGMLFELFH